MNKTESRRRLGLLVGALGVVYGDIGTSPLYALRECFNGPHAITVERAHVLGVVSLFFWSLTIIVSIKYLGLVLRAHNKGEGGILALLSLAVPDRIGPLRLGQRMLLVLGLFGATLLYGDGMLTPAVTILGAVEGLEIITPIFKPFVVPFTVAILVGLFACQRFGTGKVGSVFGSVMLLWFAVLAALGIRGIVMRPEVVFALSPHHAILFLAHNGSHALVVVGSVFLSVTGAEALYADLGHFGAWPIRRAWFLVVFPGLLLNYLGEGGLLLAHPHAAANPFFMLAPKWALLPLVVLATLAAVIASQALIAGVYSLTMQAIQMGYFPRLIIRHTSHYERGQIYMPQVNLVLLVACVGLVLAFQTSSRLAGAYGMAVSLTMLATSLLFYAVARNSWQWPGWKAGLICGGLITFELGFVVSNGLKIWQGGWFPLLIGLFIYLLMTTWNKGRQVLRETLSQSQMPFDLFLADLETAKIHRVPGTAVFLSGGAAGTPLALLHNLRHNQVLHTQVIILTINTLDIAYAPGSERLRIKELGQGFYRVTGSHGYMEQPHAPELIAACAPLGLQTDINRTTFFVSRESIVYSRKSRLSSWRRNLFVTMSRNAQSATAFFQLAPNRVVELGMQVEM
jgi:KUP system potassium uptake protein